jgi:hypothetical protein
MAKKGDIAKAKARKQKITAAALGAVFLILVVIQGPKLMKQLHKKTPAASAAATTTTTTPASATTGAPTPAGPTPGPAAVESGPATLSSGDAPPPVDQGQLASFSLFSSKDPFAQQLSTTPSTPTTSGGSTGTSAPSGSGSSAPTSQPAPGGAVISVNGTLTSVTVGGDFPQPGTSDPSAQPFFHLVSLTAHTARISIVGGSYTNGAPSVTLRENKPVTLVNTADGTRFRLILKPQGTAVPATSGTGTTTPTTPAP